MGRWFGYRPGYEDLPRIWMQPSLALEFKFLSLVEEEIRQDMHHMERMKVTPREMGVRVRAHPGRLAIVARNKMHHADIVRVSYSGDRRQTFIFDETNSQVIAANRKAVVDFLAACRETAPINKAPNASRWSIADIPAERVMSFIRSYRFHPDQSGMRADHMAGWIQRAAPDNPWNVVVIGSDKVHKRPDGAIVSLGQVDLGLAELVPAVNRAPLINPPRGTANIKALLSHDDWFADLDLRRRQGPRRHGERRPARGSAQAERRTRTRDHLPDQQGLHPDARGEGDATAAGICRPPIICLALA